MNKSSALADWTPEQLALGKRWVETWKLAAEDLERIRRKEIRELDTYKSISLLCGSADYTRPPYAPKRWLRRVYGGTPKRCFGSDAVHPTSDDGHRD